MKGAQGLLCFWVGQGGQEMSPAGLSLRGDQEVLGKPVCVCVCTCVCVGRANLQGPCQVGCLRRAFVLSIHMEAPLMGPVSTGPRPRQGSKFLGATQSLHWAGDTQWERLRS